MRKKVTVAIPVYNRENWLPQTLQSILDQKATIDEILICDNCSTDNTIPIIRQFINDNQDRSIRLHINEVNIGPYGNFNKCFELCTTDLAMIIHADDILKPNAIEKLVSYYEQNPEIAFVGGQIDFIDQDGNSLGKTPKKEDFLFRKGEILEFYSKIGVFFHPGTILYNMKFRDEFIFDTSEIGGDEKLYITTLLKRSFAVLGNPIIDSRIHLGQAGTKEYLRYDDRIAYFERTLANAKLESSPERIRKTRKYLKGWLAAHAIVVSKSVWRDFGEKRMGVRYWFYGLRKNPSYYFYKYFTSPLIIAGRRILKR